MSVRSALERKLGSDDGPQLPLRYPTRETSESFFHQVSAGSQGSQPESVYAQVALEHRREIELRRFACDHAINDQATHIAEAARAHGRVVSAEHLKDRINAFTG